MPQPLEHRTKLSSSDFRSKLNILKKKKENMKKKVTVIKKSMETH